MPFESYFWEDILDDILDEQAILLIGPQLMQFDGKSMNNYLKDSLYARNSQDIAYYYAKDGYFLFTSPESKARVAREVKRFYRRLEPDTDILQKIAQIPFPLIVSANPDTFLTETFYKYGIKHRFHFFQANQEQDNLEKPSKSMPLIYNLFGCKDKDDSLILDYDDVFKLLHSAFRDNLPHKFLRIFQNARTHIFLGFEFDKWYSQILLKFLNGETLKDKLIAVKNVAGDKETNGFIAKQFKIEMIDQNYDFFGELYQKCKERGILRAITDEASETTVKVRQAVASGDLTQALEILNQYIPQSEKNTAIMLQSQLEHLDMERDKIDSRDYYTQRNKLIDSILELAKNL